MSKRFDWEYFFLGAGLGLLAVVAAVGIGFLVYTLTGSNSACTTALGLADHRHALAESTTALTLDAWQADKHDDAAGLEYAEAGIEQNADELAAIEAEYSELKKECK